MHIKRVSDLWAKILRVLLYCRTCLFVWNRFINTFFSDTCYIIREMIITCGASG
jgi:hypothetical protein